MNTVSSMHSFSIELKSKKFVKNLIMPDEGGKVIIEGNLGKIKSLEIVEDIMLEIEGEHGSIFLDFDKEAMHEFSTSNFLIKKQEVI